MGDQWSNSYVLIIIIFSLLRYSRLEKYAHKTHQLAVENYSGVFLINSFLSHIGK